jgi:hypothetical protein
MAQEARMSSAHDSLLERITILMCGASQQQILTDHPQIEPDDFLAMNAYAAELVAARDFEDPQDRLIILDQ